MRTITGNVFYDISRRHIIGIVAGIIAMFLVYRIDYTVLLGRSRLIGGILIAVVTLIAAAFAALILAGIAFIYRLNTYQSARFANWLSNLG